MMENKIQIKIDWPCRLCGGSTHLVGEDYEEMPVRADATVHPDGSIEVIAVVCDDCNNAVLCTANHNRTLAHLLVGELLAADVPHERALERGRNYFCRLENEAAEKRRTRMGPASHWIR